MSFGYLLICCETRLQSGSSPQFRSLLSFFFFPSFFDTRIVSSVFSLLCMPYSSTSSSFKVVPIDTGPPYIYSLYLTMVCFVILCCVSPELEAPCRWFLSPVHLDNTLNLTQNFEKLRTFHVHFEVHPEGRENALLHLQETVRLWASKILLNNSDNEDCYNQTIISPWQVVRSH